MKSVSLNIAIASDHAGLSLKSALVSKLTDRGYYVIDVGTHTDEPVDYPDYANLCCDKILTGQTKLGILICGSGIGMSIAANRHNGIRCAVVSEPLSAELSRRHTDSNVIALGARLIGEEMSWRCVLTWLTTPFDLGHHVARIEKLDRVE